MFQNIRKWRNGIDRFSRRCVATTIAIAVLSISGFCDADEPDIAEITRQLTEWRNSFANLHVVWEYRSRKSMELIDAEGNPYKSDPTLDGKDQAPFAKFQWDWADHGISYLDTQVYFTLRYRTVDVWNGPGNYSYRANYSQKPGEIAKCESIDIHGLGVGRPISSVLRDPLEGLFFPATATWLPEYLAQSAANRVDFDDVDGRRCIRLRLQAITGMVVWLDPDFGYLARRRRFTAADSSGHQEVNTEKFQKLENGIWFPLQGNTRSITHSPAYREEVSDWKVTDVGANVSFANDKFAIPVPDIGTRVSDVRSGARYIVESEADRLKLTAEIAAVAKANVLASGPPPRWSVRGIWMHYSIQVTLLAMSIVSLTIAVCFRRRRLPSCGRWWMATIIAFAAFPFSTVCNADEPDIAEITRQLTEWRNSFANLHVVWEYRSRKSIELIDAEGNPYKSDPSLDGEDHRPFSKAEWDWADHGMTYWESQAFHGHRPRRVDVWSGPGNYSYTANYFQKPGEVAKCELVRVQGLGVGRPISSFLLPPLAGLFIASSATWLPEYLAQATEGPIDFDNVNGRHCVRIRFQAIKEMVLWLDPENGYLVRRCQFTPADSSGLLEVNIERFQKLENGIWFPSQGNTRTVIHSSEETIDWKVIEVGVNVNFAADKFAIPVPEIGTKVSDLRTGVSYVVASEADRSKLTAEIAAATKTTLLASSPPPQWSLRGIWVRYSLQITFLALSIVSLTIAVCFRRVSSPSIPSTKERIP